MVSSFDQKDWRGKEYQVIIYHRLKTFEKFFNTSRLKEMVAGKKFDKNNSKIKIRVK